MSTLVRSQLSASLTPQELAEHRACSLAARGCRELDAAVEAMADAVEALDRACQHNAEIAGRVNEVPGQDELERVLRGLRTIALDVVP